MADPTPSHTPDSSQALRTLAQRAGIASQYAGFWGADIHVPDATLRAALQAMGFAAQSDADVYRSLQTDAAHTASSVLPPVLVVNQGQAGAVTILAQAPVQWSLQAEWGASHSGTCMPDGGAVHITLPADLQPGYYHLRLTVGARDCADGCTVIVTPAQCWVPAPLKNGDRWWGPCVQLYAVRSARNWGVGDLGDLRELVGSMAALGASFVGLNPLHALFAQQPAVASPYSPSSRDALNALYIDVQSLVDGSDNSALRLYVGSLAFQRRLAALRDADMVDYAGVAAVKTEVLGLLWQHFRTTQLAHGTDAALVFHEFVQAQGTAVRQHALFEALQAHFAATDPAVWGWPVWPADYRDIHGPAVTQFAQEHAERVDYHLWLQWLADHQLAAAQAHARALGMGLGLYRDLAVGVNEGGSDTWMQPHMYALGMYVGAPPDPLSAMGQNWGLPPLNPVRLQAGRFQPFIDTLRANMRHAGALRLDHVMGLMRLFWLPPKGPGTYASYPLDALLGILALESVRHQCLVVGEDLGNVAPAMRQAMHERALLSYRPLFFERDNNTALRPPADWQPQALAVVSTHDLPTLRGFWRGEDLAVLSDLHLFPDAAARAQQMQARTHDRNLLVQALEDEGLLPSDMATALDTSGPLPDDITSEFVDAVYSLIARTPCWLVGVQLEDVVLQRLQVNVPGTTENMFPNWRRKVAVPVEELATDPRMRSLAATVQAGRSASPGARLKVLFVTPECAPWVKTGGLGDVSAALPQALAALGHDVKVLMPAYRHLAARAPLPAVRRAIDIPAVGVWPAARLLCGAPAHGAALVLLDCPALYDRPGGPYADASGHDHVDNARRFAFLAHVAAWLGSPDSPLPGWQADVVHGNDWQCGLVPLYLAQTALAAQSKGTTPRRHAASVLTVHNLAFQGVFPMDMADSIAVPPAWRTVQGAEYWGQLSMLKAGLQCADAITTVSPTYAREIQQSALGFGLDGVLRDKASRLHGILNGIDTAVWNPQHDPLIPQPFSTETLHLKATNKQALQQRCGLAPRPDALLLGLVGRLTWQKGIDLVVALLPWLLEQGCQLVVLGQGEPALQDALRDAAARRPDAVSVHVDFNEALAHSIEAGADVFLMPSRFEPCGLNQMYSQAYGTLPVVHATGGLADSVEDVRQGTEGVTGTGFVMPEPTVTVLQQALQRALDLFKQPKDWQQAQAQGMARDFGWEGSAREYEAVYRSLVAAR